MVERLTVKVGKEELLAHLREKHKKCMDDYEKAVKAWTLENSQWPKKAATVLKDAAAKLLASPEKWKGDRYGSSIDVPPRPTKPNKPIGLTNVIALIEMVSADTLSLSEAKYEEYMRGCRL